MLARAELPPPVRRFLEVAYPQVSPGPETILMDARGTLRRRPLPALPFSSRIFLRPGRDRVMEISLGLGPVTLLRGLDAYVDGRGFTRVGRTLQTGPPFDQGAFHTLVLETLLVPSAWERLRLTWEAVDEVTAAVLVPFGRGIERATVRFDPDGGFPASYQTQRHKGAGPRVEWRVEMSHWQRFGNLWEPGSIAVRWLDELRPWFRMRLLRVTLDADVSDALERARRALREADAPRAPRKE